MQLFKSKKVKSAYFPSLRGEELVPGVRNGGKRTILLKEAAGFQTNFDYFDGHYLHAMT